MIVVFPGHTNLITILIVLLKTLFLGHGGSKKEGKDQESIQSSTTPDPGYKWESNKLRAQLDITKEIQEVSPFPAGDHKASINRRARKFEKGSLTAWALYAYFLILKTLILSFWCGACSIGAIGESNDKSQLAKYFQISYTLERYGG